MPRSFFMPLFTQVRGRVILRSSRSRGPLPMGVPDADLSALGYYPDFLIITSEGAAPLWCVLPIGPVLCVNDVRPAREEG